MTTTIHFDLISALVDVAEANKLAGTRVNDGLGSTNDPGNFLMIGASDPDDEDGVGIAGTGDQEWAGLGAKASYENGTVSCCALAWSGDVGNDAQRAAREAVRDIVATLDAALKADPNLGGVVPGLNWVRFGQTFNFTQMSNADGTAALFEFEIAYRARLV